MLLVTVDTLRADHLGSYGARDAHTVVFDTVAAAGVRFTAAVSPAPLTLPAHASLMTALDPPEHGVRHNGIQRLGSGIPTLAEHMRDAGYTTAAVVGAVVLDRRFGLERGFDFYDDAMHGRVSSTVGFPERSADRVVDAALAWLDAAPDRFFLWVHFYDPHARYEPPPGFASAFASRPYAGEIAFVDAQLGRLLESIRQRWPDDRTLIVLTSDHGESLGEHGEATHAHTLYEATQRVPLLMSGASLPRGRIVDAPVGLVDVAPTLLALAGAAPLPGATGRNLAAWIEGAPEADRPIYVETVATHLDHGWSALFGLRTPEFKYIRAPRPELYDLRADPAELHDLAAAKPEVVARFEELLAPHLAAAPRGEARLADPLDESERARLRSLGYVVPDFDGALPSPAEMVGPDPKDAMATLRTLGEAQHDVDRGRLGDALARLAGVESGGTAVPALRAAIAVATGDYPLAEADARRVLAAQPNRSDVWIILGRALAGQARLAEARRAFDAAASLDPRSVEAHLYRGRLSEALELPDDAIAAYAQALRVAPSTVEAGWRLAVLYLEQDELDRAEPVLADLAQREGELEPGATVRLALAEARVGRRDAAQARIARARALHPEDSELARLEEALGPQKSGSPGHPVEKTSQ